MKKENFVTNDSIAASILCIHIFTALQRVLEVLTYFGCSMHKHKHIV